VHKNDMATHEPACKKRNKGKTLEQRQKAAEKKRLKRLKEQGVAEGDVDDEIAAMERKLAALKAAKAGGRKVPDTSSLIPPNPNVEGPSDTRTGKKIDLEAEIQKAAMDKAPGSEDDGRIPCSCCGRKFNPDRIVTHEDICLRSKEKRMAQKKKIKPKTGEDLRLKNTEFAKYKNKRAPDVEKKSRWRQEAVKLMNIVQAGRNVVRFQRAGVPLSELPPSGEDIASGYSVGDPVMTNDGRRGEVMWVGEIPELPGDEEGQIRTFIGVEFNNKVGQHDGTCKASGKRLFNGRSGHCSFFLPPKLLRVKSAAGADLKTNFKRKKDGFQARRKPGMETHKVKKLTAKFEDMARPKYATQKIQPQPPSKPKVTAESRPQAQSAAAKAAAARMERMANGSGANATRVLRSTQSAGEQKRSAKPRQAGGMVSTHADGTVQKLRTKVKKARSARGGSSKENRPQHMQAWGGKNGVQTTERKKPYGNQTLSNASLKYRANKTAGAPSQEAASAAYKARMRLKKNASKAKSQYKSTFGQDRPKVKNAAAKRAKAKPAFGSAAKSVSDDLNEFVFGKEKKQKEYLANGKFRYKTAPREKQAISKKRTSPRTTSTSNKLGGGSPPSKREVRSNPVNMGNKGKSLGGAGKGRALNNDDVRAKRLAFLERMQNGGQ